jgi:predicted lipoprotein with Yx(FWY)xxD motif
MEQNPIRRSALRKRGRSAAVVAGMVCAFAAVAMSAMPASAADAPTTATTISTAKDGKAGTILVSGNTVYTLKPSKTACDAKCLKAWPPVLLPQGVMTAVAGTGVDASKLGTKTTATGDLQITYGGKPLYWFFKDKTAGQVRGNITDKWGKWATVVTVKGSGSGGSGNSNAGTGGTAF